MKLTACFCIPIWVKDVVIIWSISPKLIILITVCVEPVYFDRNIVLYLSRYHSVMTTSIFILGGGWGTVTYFSLLWAFIIKLNYYSTSFPLFQNNRTCPLCRADAFDGTHQEEYFWKHNNTLHIVSLWFSATLYSFQIYLRVKLRTLLNPKLTCAPIWLEMFTFGVSLILYNSSLLVLLWITDSSSEFLLYRLFFY